MEHKIALFFFVCSVQNLEIDILSNKFQIVTSKTVPKFGTERNLFQTLNNTINFRLLQNRVNCAVVCNLNCNCKAALLKNNQCILFNSIFDDGKLEDSFDSTIYNKVNSSCLELNTGFFI